MRTIPFTEKTENKPAAETPAPAAEAKPETTPAPAPPKEPQKNFLQKYGWLIIVALLIAAAWFFNKYKLVPKIPIPIPAV